MSYTVTLTLPLSAAKRLATLRIGDLKLDDPLGTESPVLQEWQTICAEAAKAVDAANDEDLLPPSMRGVTPPAWFTAAPDDPFADPPEESDEERAERAKAELQAAAQELLDDVLLPFFRGIAQAATPWRAK